MRKVLYIFGLLTDEDVEWIARTGTRRVHDVAVGGIELCEVADVPTRRTGARRVQGQRRAPDAGVTLWDVGDLTPCRRGDIRKAPETSEHLDGGRYRR